MKKSSFDYLFFTLFILLIFYFGVLPMLYIIRYDVKYKINDPIKLLSDACEERELCPQNKVFRNECALAADFEKCLLIKTDGSTKFLACNNDGASTLIKEIKPNVFFCFGTLQGVKLISTIIK